MTILIDTLKKKLKELQTKNPSPRKIRKDLLRHHVRNADAYNNEVMRKLKNSYEQNS